MGADIGYRLFECFAEIRSSAGLFTPPPFRDSWLDIQARFVNEQSKSLGITHCFTNKPDLRVTSSVRIQIN